MRLWSIHPLYLDTRGLVACWREGLLAQKALAGETKNGGYQSHPQLDRFRIDGAPNTTGRIRHYLYHIWIESKRRGYNFNLSKIEPIPIASGQLIRVTTGQLHYELEHLHSKLVHRGHDHWSKSAISLTHDPVPHPFFLPITKDQIEPWEKLK